MIGAMATRAVGLNHVSVVAHDLAESVRFYRELFGMQEIPTPDFGFPVQWLRLGDLQLHLFERPDGPPIYAHLALEVDDVVALVDEARRRGILDATTFGYAVAELPGGEARSTCATRPATSSRSTIRTAPKPERGSRRWSSSRSDDRSPPGPCRGSSSSAADVAERACAESRHEGQPPGARPSAVLHAPDRAVPGFSQAPSAASAAIAYVAATSAVR